MRFQSIQLRRSALIYALALAGAFIAGLGSLTSHAARSMIADDACLVDAKVCQVES